MSARLALNREFLVRHLFALAVFVVLGGWFGYDAFARYPACDARELYVRLEKSEPKEGTNLEAFKAQKISTQRIFAGLTLLAALGVGLHLLAVSRFSFSWDDAGFVCNGRRRAWDEIVETDDSRWAKGNILKLVGKDWSVNLDAWHHTGVRDVAARLGVTSPSASPGTDAAAAERA